MTTLDKCLGALSLVQLSNVYMFIFLAHILSGTLLLCSFKNLSLASCPSCLTPRFFRICFAVFALSLSLSPKVLQWFLGQL